MQWARSGDSAMLENIALAVRLRSGPLGLTLNDVSVSIKLSRAWRYQSQTGFKKNL